MSDHVSGASHSSERAKMLEVVSVIRRNPDGTWHGDMLDGLAFEAAQDLMVDFMLQTADATSTLDPDHDRG